VDPAHNLPFWVLQDEVGCAVPGSETWVRPPDATTEEGGV
jgi:hypothetical protein